MCLNSLFVKIVILGLLHEPFLNEKRYILVHVFQVLNERNVWYNI